MGFLKGLFGSSGSSQADLIRAQEQASLFNFGVNNPNVTNTFDSRTVTQTGNRFNINDQLNPGQQGIFDANMQFNQGLFDLANQGIDNPLNFDDLTQFAVADGSTRQGFEDAFLDRRASRLNPQFKQLEDQRRASLGNQGFGIGSEGFTTSLGNLGRDRNDAFALAANDAILFGGQEEERAFGLHSDEVLHRERDARLLVRLDLRAVDHEVGV